MKTKNNREIKRIFILLAFIALATAMAGCSATGSNNSAATPTPDVNRNAPSNVSATQTPTPNAAEAMLGVWETRDPRVVSKVPTTGSTPPDFVRLKINYGTEDKGNYKGEVTDVTNNLNVGDYTLYPNKSVKLDVSTLGLQGTFDYDIAGDGNTMSLKTDSNPIIFKRGTANTDVEKDARIISDPTLWDATPSTKTSIETRFKNRVDSVSFDPATVSGEGYGGRMDLNQVGMGMPVGTGTYIISPNKKIIIDIGSGRTEGNYSIETNGDLLRIKFADGTEWVFNKIP